MPTAVSIIVPIKDQHDRYINQCIESLKNQEFSEPYEIIVTMGGNRAQARNTGINLAQGKIIAFIDADCVAPKNWLAVIVENLRSNVSVEGVGGTNDSPPDNSYLGQAIDQVFLSPLGSLGSASLADTSKPRKVNALACINSAFRSQILRDIGGFDEEFELCEDTNLSYKVHDKGGDMLFLGNISVWHYRRDTIKNFSKQFFLYGLGRTRSMMTEKKYISKPAIALLSIVVAFPFLVYFFPIYAILSTVFYILALLAFGIKGAIKKKRKEFTLFIPFLLIIEHFSYLFGLILGFTKGKWQKTANTSELFRQITCG